MATNFLKLSGFNKLFALRKKMLYYVILVQIHHMGLHIADLLTDSIAGHRQSS